VIHIEEVVLYCTTTGILGERPENARKQQDASFCLRPLSLPTPTMSRLQFSSVDEMFTALTADEVQRARCHSEAQAAKIQLELRDLVAQRYPDLLAGADTVLGLTDRVATMREMLRGVPVLCGELVSYEWNDNIMEADVDSLKGGPTQQQELQQQELQLQWTQQPERIWSALDKLMFSEAARLYLQSARDKQVGQYRLRYLGREIWQRARLYLTAFDPALNASIDPRKMSATDVSALCAVVVFGDTIEDTLDFLLARRLEWIKTFINDLKTSPCAKDGRCEGGGGSAVQRMGRKNGSVGGGGDDGLSEEIQTDGTSSDMGGRLQIRLKILCARILAVVDCVRATLSLVFRAFIQTGLSEEMKRLLASLPSQVHEMAGVSGQDMLFQLQAQIHPTVGSESPGSQAGEQKKTKSGVDVESVSRWFQELLAVIEAAEEVWLPRSISAHQVVKLQKYLRKYSRWNDARHGASAGDWQAACNGLRLDRPYPSLVASGASPGQALCATLLEKMISARGQSLLGSALSKSIHAYSTSVRQVLDRIKECDSGVAAVTGQHPNEEKEKVEEDVGGGGGGGGDDDGKSRILSAAAGPHSNYLQQVMRLKHSSGFIKFRDEAKREKQWSEEYAQATTERLAVKLHRLQRDNQDLSEGLLRPSSPNSPMLTPPLSAAAPLEQAMQEGMHAALLEIHDFLSSFLGSMDTVDDGHSALADQALFVGSCAHALCMMQLRGDGSRLPEMALSLDSSLAKKLKALAKKSLSVWAGSVSQTCVFTFAQGLGRMLCDDRVDSSGGRVGGAVGKRFRSSRYGWVKFDIGVVLETDGGESAPEKVDVPSMASPFVAQLLFDAHHALIRASSTPWCGENDLVPYRGLSSKLWHAVNDIFCSRCALGTTQAAATVAAGEADGRATAHMVLSEEASLQLILDVGVLLCVFGKEDSTECRMATLRKQLINRIDPIEWTLYESLLSSVVASQVQRNQYFAPQRRAASRRPARVLATSALALQDSEDRTSQNIMKMAKMSSRFALLPVARVARRPYFNSQDGKSDEDALERMGGTGRRVSATSSTSAIAPNNTTYTASSLLSTITSGIWGE
jgi:hypothetical protein